jgi:hypothetical protein
VCLVLLGLFGPNVNQQCRIDSFTTAVKPQKRRPGLEKVVNLIYKIIWVMWLNRTREADFTYIVIID